MLVSRLPGSVAEVTLPSAAWYEVGDHFSLGYSAYVTWKHLVQRRTYLCLLRREGQGDDNLILRNCNVCQVGRLDPEVRHVNGAGCSTRYRITHDFSLHVKDLFVGFAMHRQIAG